MIMETLLNVLSDARVNITACDKDTIYIAKPDPDGDWYQPNPWDEVYNILVENGINFATDVYNHEDIFQIDDLDIVIYTEE